MALSRREHRTTGSDGRKGVPRRLNEAGKEITSPKLYLRVASPLKTGLRAWLGRCRTPAGTAPPPSPATDGLGYRPLRPLLLRARHPAPLHHHHPLQARRHLQARGWQCRRRVVFSSCLRRARALPSRAASSPELLVQKSAVKRVILEPAL